MVERTIVVTAIPFGADEKILFKHFSKCGLIEDLQMIYNKKSEPLDCKVAACPARFRTLLRLAGHGLWSKKATTMRHM